MLLTDNFLLDLLLLTTTLLVAVVAYFHHAYQYWAKKGVPFLPPKFPLGNSHSLISKTPHFTLENRKYYYELKKRGWKFAGVYTITRPVLVVIDPDYIRDILSKDFAHFVNRGGYYNEKDNPISAHLFNLNEDKWKNIRTKLTPTFTTGKMKMMFEAVLSISEYLVDFVDKSAQAKTDIDIQEVLACFTTDVIGNCAYGIDCNSFKDPDAEFRKMGLEIFKAKGLSDLTRLLLISQLPELALKLRLKSIRADVSKFFHEAVENVVKYREENNVLRPDFIQLLIDLKNTSKDTVNPFTLDQMASQVFLFFVAGFDTSSTTMNYAIYELCRNPDIQEKVREEINEVLNRHGGQVTYDSLAELKYLQQVIDESLRLYPPVTNLTRRCVKDYKLHDTSIVIEKGTTVLIPLYALQRDADYYPDPDKFDPERFNAENKKTLHPYVHLPFGEGPRNCIGLRFGLMQSKIGLVAILRKFRLRISPSTRMPIRLNDKVFLLKSLDTLYITAEKI